MPEQPALRLVDDDGVLVEPPQRKSDYVKALEEEVAGLNRQLNHLQDQLDGAERDVRSWRARFAELQRDKEKDAKKHPLYRKAEELFAEWQRLCRHPRSKWDWQRFEVVRPFLKDHDYDLCLLAIQGAAFDPYTKARANGSIKRFDDWDLIFKSASKFEEFCSRASAEDLKAYKAKTEAAAELADEREETDT